jgi:hypothetical protein
LRHSKLLNQGLLRVSLSVLCLSLGAA